MQRRRYRAHSATLDGEARLNPALLLLVLAIGVMAGFVCTNPGQVFGTGTSREEQYLVLTATLYGQGESASSIKRQLVGMGYTNPAAIVLQLSDKLQTSADPEVQRQAELLRQLGDALTVATDEPSNQPTPTVEATSVAVAPSAEATEVPSAGTTTPAPTPAVTPTSTAGSTRTGKVHTDTGQSAMIRSQPSTDAPARGGIPTGSDVEILETVSGEEVEAGDDQWYRVKYGQVEGYVYGQLVETGD